MKAKDVKGKNLGGYAILYARDIASIKSAIHDKEAQKALLYNINEFIFQEHGYGKANLEPMDGVQEALYDMITSRIKEQIERARYGAPKGNTNARAKGYEQRKAKVEELYTQGLTPTQIERETGYPRTTIRDDIKKIKSEKEAQAKQEQDAKYEEIGAGALYGYKN